MLLDEAITRSAAYSELLRLVKRVAPAETSVLIAGETGTGKDYVAELIHDASPRRSRPLIKIDCASIPASLAESEFFGYEKGAFSDAFQSKPGRLQLSDGGTVYLDGINHLAAAVQSKLLRFAQERKLEPLGGDHPVHVDCRILSSISVPLRNCLAEKQLREDLYYRLAGMTIEVTPLRERIEDIEMLVASLLREFSEKYRKNVTFVAEALQVLKQYHWPGNIRELRNVVEQAVIHGTGVVAPADLALGQSVTQFQFLGHAAAEGLSLEDMERMYISEVLRRVDGHYGKAAEILKINRKTLLIKRRKYGIES